MMRLSGRDPCVESDDGVMPAGSESYGRHRRPLHPEIFLPDFPSYCLPLSPDLHTRIINNELDMLTRERPGTFPWRYVPGVPR
jgi:hypothetical protein